MLIKRLLPGLTMFVLSACSANVPGNGSGSVAGDDTSVAREALVSAPGDEGDRGDQHKADVRHVLLISVDGLHQVDAARFIAEPPELDAGGARAHWRRVHRRPHARRPADSFPGLVALVTGGTPKTTGVYYDDSYDRTLFPPGSNCQGNPGTECTYFEILAKDFTQLFSPIDPANLPMHKDVHGQLHAASSRTTSSRSTRSSRSSAPRAATRRGPTSTRPTTW